MQEQIYYLDNDTLLKKGVLEEYIYPDTKHNYYWSDDLSCEFYINLAYSGFISVGIEEGGKEFLLPEIQFEYAVLDFKDLHISKKVQKLINKGGFSFSINQNFKHVLELIKSSRSDSWIHKKYSDMLEKLFNYKHPSIEFKLISVELYDKQNGELVACEIGYRIGRTYTSLSGFSKRDKKYNNYGKLQMVLLAKYLEQNDYAFWNMGHPYMDYKFDLGAKVYSREDFLTLWQQNI